MFFDVFKEANLTLPVSKATLYFVNGLLCTVIVQPKKEIADAREHANAPDTPTSGEVITSETEANALHVTPVMDKIAETSSKGGILFFSNKYNYIYYAFKFTNPPRLHKHQDLIARNLINNVKEKFFISLLSVLLIKSIQ
ncbi:hypothetical protein C1646_765799 [Rhizophagus diaphanus]|nr:hypothetical protein C1646_765799 [Rhizophagus diaphanus] [Rhizophagus sp. MUCL 43196]